ECKHGDGRSPANQREHLSKYTVAVQIRSCMSLWWMDDRLSSAILLSCVVTPEHLRVTIWTTPLCQPVGFSSQTVSGNGCCPVHTSTFQTYSTYLSAICPNQSLPGRI